MACLKAPGKLTEVRFEPEKYYGSLQFNHDAALAAPRGIRSVNTE